MAATRVAAWNCRDCRSTIARAISPAIAASGSAAISKAWRGSPRCAATNSSAIRRRRRRSPPTLPGRAPATTLPPRHARRADVPPASRIASIDCNETSHQPIWKHAVETAQKRPAVPAGRASRNRLSLTPVENSAFNELARQLSARLESETGAAPKRLNMPSSRAVAEPPPRKRPNRPASGPTGWRSPSRRRAAKPRATGRCSICFRSAC